MSIRIADEYRFVGVSCVCCDSTHGDNSMKYCSHKSLKFLTTAKKMQLMQHLWIHWVFEWKGRLQFSEDKTNDAIRFCKVQI